MISEDMDENSVNIDEQNSVSLKSIDYAFALSEMISTCDPNIVVDYAPSNSTYGKESPLGEIYE
jgi:hypothetical protein